MSSLILHGLPGLKEAVPIQLYMDVMIIFSGAGEECHTRRSGAEVAAESGPSVMWLTSAVGSLNVARLGGVSLKPVVNGQVSSTEAPVEAGSLWAGTGAVIFTVRRAG